MDKPPYIHFLILTLILSSIIPLSGCAFFRTLADCIPDSIPDRLAFSEESIDQGSFAELKESYTKHYQKVLDELHRLEKDYQSSKEKPDRLAQKIKNHKKYLSDMETYPFLCPTHNVEYTENCEKQCPSCNGKGKNFWGNPCPTCSGEGEISYQISKKKKCPYCKQLYRGIILGRTLYEN